MSWFDGIPQVIALAAASVAVGLTALAIAHTLRLDRRLFGSSRAGSPERSIERLAGLADVARAEGLLSAEGRIDPLAEPILAAGMKLVVEGARTDDIAGQLDRDLETCASRSLLGPVFQLLGRWPSLWAVLAAGPLLTVILSSGGDPGAVKAWAGLAALGFAGLAGWSAIAQRWVVAQDPAAVLARLMEAETVLLIRAGLDGNAVRQRLQALMPPSRSAALAQAA